MGAEVWGWLGTLVSAIAVLISGALGARANRRAKHDELTTPSYDSLAERLERSQEREDKLRADLDGVLARVRKLEDDRHTDRAWIRRAVEESQVGGGVVLPPPPWYGTDEDTGGMRRI